MPAQLTVHPAQRASGNCSALSDARLLSAVATHRDPLAPDVALNLPAVLDRPALLDVMPVLTTDTNSCSWCGRPGCQWCPANCCPDPGNQQCRCHACTTALAADDDQEENYVAWPNEPYIVYMNGANVRLAGEW